MELFLRLVGEPRCHGDAFPRVSEALERLSSLSVLQAFLFKAQFNGKDLIEEYPRKNDENRRQSDAFPSPAQQRFGSR